MSDISKSKPINQPPPQTSRKDQTRQIVILGAPGTGKSTISKKLVEAKLKTKNNRCIVISPQEFDPAWANAKKIDYENTDSRSLSFEGVRFCPAYDDDVWNFVFDREYHFRNGMIVLDDVKCLVPDNRPVKSLNRVFISRRHYRLDIVLVAHGWRELPPRWLTYMTDLFLFKTLDSCDYRETELHVNYQKIKQLEQKVQQKSQKDLHYFDYLNLSAFY